MNGFEREVILTNASAIWMQVSYLVGDGVEMERAKQMAIAKYAIMGIPDYLRAPTIELVHSMGYGDLFRDDLKKLRRRHYYYGVEAGIWRDNWWNRLRFHLQIL